MKLKIKKVLLILMSMMIILLSVACSTEKLEEGKIVDELFVALKDQDLDKIDEIIPESGLSKLIYNDEEGFGIYMNNMTWEIGEIEEDGEDKLVNINVTNSDMASLLGDYEQVEGAQLPDFPKSAVDEAKKIHMDIKLRVVEDEGNNKIELEMEDLFNILNVITGGAFKVLEENLL